MPGWLSFAGQEVRWSPVGVFGNRQHLLPYEQQICDAIGITEEEYFDYFELVQQYKKARPEEYANYVPERRQ